MTDFDVDRLQREVDQTNKLIRESGSLFGFSLTLNRVTGVVDEVAAYPIAGVSVRAVPATPTEQLATRVRALDQDVLVRLYLQLRQQLTTPPTGWYTFGTHLDIGTARLEFWGTGGDGLPIWERPIA